ncbi:MAG TPA: hypothetical protein VH475_08985 [Tepidisphaeraceae bacterium]|jgi:hypothetical protein
MFENLESRQFFSMTLPAADGVSADLTPTTVVEADPTVAAAKKGATKVHVSEIVVSKRTDSATPGL